MYKNMQNLHYLNFDNKFFDEFHANFFLILSSLLCLTSNTKSSPRDPLLC